MKLGYPCINRSIGCAADKKFRLASYSEEKLISTVRNNLDCLQRILEYNVANGFFFFRISSDTVPFASHPICQFDWHNHFKKQLSDTGNFIKENDIRISMHPDQFILINSPDEDITNRSISELDYHSTLLDSMHLGPSAKIQIHVGGVYKNREKAMQRFLDRYDQLPKKIKKRLVIENDDRSYPLSDCLTLHSSCSIPIIFDTLHHECLNTGETLQEAQAAASLTWGPSDGLPMIDYSTQQPGERKGRHTTTIDTGHFRTFLEESRALDFDIMLEIKDKEKSAHRALSVAREMGRI